MKFSSNGKLLLTGEYLVLDGAKSIALPTTYGQHLFVEENETEIISWKSFNEKHLLWFKDEFEISKLISGSLKSDNEISDRLIQILRCTNNLNPDFLISGKGYSIKTTQDFNRKWGLGTSSTLINNISNWANVDAYKLLELTFGGSGYDIACAKHDNALTYQILGDKPTVTAVEFNPSFKDNIYFVYLNKKQNSRDGIASYKTYKADLSTAINDINNISERMINCKSLSIFENLVQEHEQIISKIINQQCVKPKLFADYNGAVKSLGAWGGDFVLVTSKHNPTDYFKAKGYHTIIPYSQMIKT